MEVIFTPDARYARLCGSAEIERLIATGQWVRAKTRIFEYLDNENGEPELVKRELIFGSESRLKPLSLSYESHAGVVV
jgi:hypothetical protein